MANSCPLQQVGKEGIVSPRISYLDLKYLRNISIQSHTTSFVVNIILWSTVKIQAYDLDSYFLQRASSNQIFSIGLCITCAKYAYEWKSLLRKRTTYHESCDIFCLKLWLKSLHLIWEKDGTNTHVTTAITFALPLPFNQPAFRSIKFRLVLNITYASTKRKWESAAGLIVLSCYTIWNRILFDCALQGLIEEGYQNLKSVFSRTTTR